MVMSTYPKIYSVMIHHFELSTVVQEHTCTVSATVLGSVQLVITYILKESYSTSLLYCIVVNIK